MKRSLPVLGFSVGLAAALFALTFRGPRKRFWDHMTGTGIVLGGLALTAQPELRRTRIGLKEILLGIGSAAALYGLFQLGDRMARRIVPHGGEQIDSIYALKRIRPRRELMLRLGLVVGPSEEYFWRGFLQDGLMKKFGRFKGWLLGSAAYGGVHLASGNFTLIGAAAIAGGFWGALYALGVPLGALIVSHICWDNIIFLIAPTTRLEEEKK
ncbi:MAG TPA: CPBP family intramembrane glutamic endopeptidase [Anaerolineales bacterium]|nr:CPBP family intramembrane glutamic endopeptidase [Anaerolineales bacterium]